MTTTRYSDAGISLTTNVYCMTAMLAHAQPQIVLDRFALQATMPKNKRQTVQWRRPVPFTAATTPLAEGVTPTARQFQYQKVTATILQYGDVIEITDVVNDTAEDPVLNDASMMCGENIGRTKEALTFAVVKAGTSVTYTNGTARTDVNTPISLSKIRSVVRSLQAQKAEKITSILDSSPNYGTQAIEAAYVGVAHTDVAADIRNLAGFVPVASYGSRRPIHEREMGTVEDVRFILSADLGPFASGGGAKAGSGTTMVSTDGTNADVYPVLIFGKEAYGTVSLRGVDAVAASVILPGKREKSDVLGQRGYVGFLFWHAAVRLNELWLNRLECAATSL